MQLVELRKWSVRCEPDLTREAYALIDCGGAEQCGCEPCFNFAATRHLLYDAEVLEFLDTLGIDPLLEADVSHDACLGAGRHGRGAGGRSTCCADRCRCSSPTVRACAECSSISPASAASTTLSRKARALSRSAAPRSSASSASSPSSRIMSICNNTRFRFVAACAR